MAPQRGFVAGERLALVHRLVPLRRRRLCSCFCGLQPCTCLLWGNEQQPCASMSETGRATVKCLGICDMKVSMLLLQVAVQTDVRLHSLAAHFRDEAAGMRSNLSTCSCASRSCRVCCRAACSAPFASSARANSMCCAAWNRETAHIRHREILAVAAFHRLNDSVSRCWCPDVRQEQRRSYSALWRFDLARPACLCRKGRAGALGICSRVLGAVLGMRCGGLGDCQLRGSKHADKLLTSAARHCRQVSKQASWQHTYILAKLRPCRALAGETMDKL